MAESTEIKEVLIIILGAEVQDATIATQLFLQQQKSLATVVVLYCHTLQQSISVVEQTFDGHPQWPQLILRPVSVDTTLESFQFDLFTNTLYIEVKYWLARAYQIHLLLASECRSMAILGMSVAQVLLSVEDHMWNLHMDSMLRKSNQMLLSDVDQAQLLEIHFPRLRYTPIYFTSFIQAESMQEACAKLVEEQQRSLQRFVTDELTPAERDIAALVAMGSSNDEIAKRLHIVEKTVKTHVTKIYRKLEEKFGLQANPQLKRKFLQTKLRKWLSL